MSKLISTLQLQWIFVWLEQRITYLTFHSNMFCWRICLQIHTRLNWQKSEYNIIGILSDQMIITVSLIKDHVKTTLVNRDIKLKNLIVMVDLQLVGSIFLKSRWHILYFGIRSMSLSIRFVQRKIKRHYQLL